MIQTTKTKKKKTTVTVKVVNNAVKKVKLNKKNASLNVGGSVSLKATVSANKGASKRIYWKSSKTSVKLINNTPYIECNISLSANISSLNKDLDYSDKKTLKTQE